jgi:hypothetical protein
MINSLKDKISYNPFKLINSAIAYGGIKGKMLLEDIGISTYKPGLNEYDKLSKSDQ